MKMKPLSLKDIVDVTGGTYFGDTAKIDELISSVIIDSRKAESGSLFVCTPGEHVDGHDFAAKAIAAGAVCCLAQRKLDNNIPYILVNDTLEALKLIAEYYRTLFDIPFVGIIGSVGKTTAKEMTAAVLSQKYNVLKTPENLNNEIGVPLTLLSLREEHSVAVVEMGISDFGEMSRLAKMVQPDICLMTAIGYCHLETLGDLDGVLKAKSEVFNFMSTDGIAIVNGDDKKLAAFDPGIKKITFGLGCNNDFRAENITNKGFDGVTCNIFHNDAKFDVLIPAFGSHMVLAALAAAAVGAQLGISDDDTAKGLLTYMPVGGRANVEHTDYITIINDCYNANPNSVTASLTSLSTLKDRRVAILGDMNELGRKSDDLHRSIGVLAGQLGIDCLICCGKKAEFIYKGHISGGTKLEAWFFPMKDAFFSVLPSLIKKDDVVLVKASHSMHFEEIVEELRKLQ